MKQQLLRNNKRWLAVRAVTDSLSLKVALILFTLLLSLLMAIYFLVKREATQSERMASESFIVQATNNSIERLQIELAKVQMLSSQQASLAGFIDRNVTTYKQVLSENLMNYEDNMIVGAGYWSLPAYAFDGVNALVWKRNAFGFFEYDDSFERNLGYTRTEWFSVATLTRPGQCFWSVVLHANQEKTFTCATAVFSDGVVIGVFTVDIRLSAMRRFVVSTAQSTEAYVLLVGGDEIVAASSKYNRSLPKFLSAGNYVSKYTERYANFSLVQDAIKSFDLALLYNAYKRLGKRFDELSEQLLSQTDIDMNKLAINIAILNENTTDYYAEQSSTLFAMATLVNDPIFSKKDARAYVFHVPRAYWKMVVVIPESRLNGISNEIMAKLLVFLILASVVFGVSGYVLLELNVLRPLRETANNMGDISDLISHNQFSVLRDKKNSEQRYDDIGVMNAATNLLVDRIIETEKNLSLANEVLEERVEMRTAELVTTLDDLERSQVRLIQAEKMSLLGQMVAGVTHELNTPLGYIKSNLMLCQESMLHFEMLVTLNVRLRNLIRSQPVSPNDLCEAESELKTLLEKLEKEEVADEASELFDDVLFGVEQISSLVVDLKDFARLDESKIKQVDVHECIDSALKTTRAQLINVNVCEQYNELPSVYCAPSQINQVLLNIINNAISAMSDAKHKMLYISTSFDEKYVIVKIRDSGRGIPEAIKFKVFEPFFTTGASSQGTGLGLPICKQIVEAHQGKIDFDSKMGKGTVFTIYLPRGRAKFKNESFLGSEKNG